MKTTLLFASVLYNQSSAFELMNLKNIKLSKITRDIIKPFESLVHIQTFDEIPVFGGKDYRKTLLEQDLQQVKGFSFDASLFK